MTDATIDPEKLYWVVSPDESNIPFVARGRFVRGALKLIGQCLTSEEVEARERAAELRGFEAAINYAESITDGTGSAILSHKMRAALARRRSEGERR